MELNQLIKKNIKEIQKLKSQKQIKLNKRNQLDEENNLKNQYEKLEKILIIFLMV